MRAYYMNGEVYQGELHISIIYMLFWLEEFPRLKSTIQGSSSKEKENVP